MHYSQALKSIIEMILFKKGIILFTLFSVLFGDIKVISKSTLKEISINTLKGEDKVYISTKDLVAALSSRLYENLERKKLVLYVSGKRIKITAGNSFLIIDDIAYQMVDIVKEYTILEKIQSDIEKELSELDK